MENTKLVRFKKNHVLFRIGDKSRELYIIRSGKVKVIIRKNGRNIPLVTLGKGSFIGEMSFISGMPRSATVVATGPVVANVITTDVLSDDILSVNNWALSIAKVLVERIKRTTELVGDYILSRHDKEIEKTAQVQSGEKEPFSLRSQSSVEPARIYLKGYMTGDRLNGLKEKIRELKRKNYKKVVIDFSDVIDIDQTSLNYLSELTHSSPFGDTTVLIENVQLIRNKILSIRGIRNIISTTQLSQKRIPQGEVIIREGETENIMYIVKTGSFTVYNEIDGERIVLQKVESGGVIGEMTLIKGGKRSANVVADQTSIVYEVDISEFYKNMYHLPNWFLEIIKGLVERLRSTNEILESLVREDKESQDRSESADSLGISLNTGKPGSIELSGNMLIENLEYLALLIHHQIEKGITDFLLEMNDVDKVDRESIAYLLNLYKLLQGKGGSLRITGPHKDIFYLFRQYDISD